MVNIVDNLPLKDSLNACSSVLADSLASVKLTTNAKPTLSSC